MDNNALFSDEYLVRLAQQGHQEAYNQLFKRYRHKVEQIIYFHLGDNSQVNDLVQEVLLKVYRYLDHFQEKSQFKTWLYRITQNTLKNYYRSISTQIALESDCVEEYSFPTSHQSPEYLLIHDELGERLGSAMSLLSEDLRLCYGLYLFDGQSYEAIAKKMDCPIGTVRSRIFRAKKMLMSSVHYYFLN